MAKTALVTAAFVFAACVFAVACEAPRQRAVPAPRVATSAVTPAVITSAPHTPAAPSASNEPGAGGRPPIEAACARDDECEVVNTTFVGNDTCCPGCRWHAGTKTSLRAFEASGVASPAPTCPPVGRAMALAAPRCVADACVVAPQRLARFTPLPQWPPAPRCKGRLHPSWATVVAP